MIGMIKAWDGFDPKIEFVGDELSVNIFSRAEGRADPNQMADAVRESLLEM